MPTPLAPTDLPTTLGALRASSYVPRSVREEIRANLEQRLSDGVALTSDVLGYDDTVIRIRAFELDPAAPASYGRSMTDLVGSKYGLSDDQVEKLRSLAVLKGGEYAGDHDRLANFRRNAGALGLTMEQVWRVYAGKHWDAVTQYINDVSAGKDRPRLESILGRADDLIVYLVLFKAMVEERSPRPLPVVEELTAAGVLAEGPQCTHQWMKVDRYTDTCAFCNAMRPHAGRNGS